MDIIGFSIKKPVTVTVGVLLIVMFGLIGFSAMPIQLSPNVDRPLITVTTTWPGRSPEEVVDEIAKEQEEELKNVSGLKKMKSVSREGAAEISLEFYIGTNIDRAMQEVSDALRQVPEYPQDVEEPTIKAADAAAENAITWIIIDVDPEHRDKHRDFDISTLFDPIDKELKPFLERIDGVAEVNVYGGREREVRVLVDATRLAQRGISHLDVVNALRRENRNISAGTIAEGKRDYRVRVLGQFESAEDILSTIITTNSSGTVYVEDVATVEIAYEKRRGFVRSLGEQSIAVNCIRRSGANVMRIMEDVRAEINNIRDNVLPTLDPAVGPHLRIRQVYDETFYIQSAIDLVTQNLWVGGSIAAIVLLLFLRSFTSTGIIALAIPISVIGTFLVLLALGRSLNVVSLAGLAFAVGMVVDNAIVVLENIFRHREMGKPPIRAAYDGGKEVWGAVLASTLTTIAVFVPILTVQEEAGQLFRDISLAIVASVTLSLVVSITVIPAASSRWFSHIEKKKRSAWRRSINSLFGLTILLGRLNEWLGTLLKWLMTGWRGWTIRPGLIVVLTIASLWGARVIMPPLDYLPAGNRNLVFGGLLIPPGYSVEQMEEIASRIESKIEPYTRVDAADDSAVRKLPPIQQASFGGPPGEPYEPVPVDNFFIGSFNGGMFIGGTSAWPTKVKPVEALLTNSMSTIPDAYGGASQSSLFGRGVAAGGNTIDVEIAGPTLEKVLRVATPVFYSLAEEYGFGKVRAAPANFLIKQQEQRVELTHTARELGIRTEEMGVAVRALFDGAFAGEFRDRGDAYDIRLVPAGGRLENKEQLATIPIATPVGQIVPMSTLVSIEPGLAPQEIHRIEELPSVTVSVTKPDDQPLQQVMDDIQQNILAPLRQSGAIDQTMRVRLEGTAARLDEVRESLFGAAPAQDESQAGWQRAVEVLSLLLVIGGVLCGIWAVIRAVVRRKAGFAYGAAGVMLLATILAGLFLGVAMQPQLATARFIWALAVTYLLMCALFESFLYPLVIMFSVPLAIIGGFIGLRIVHDFTDANPLIAAQNLDVLTMLGFVILIGVVVNNAILIVHQSLVLMRGGVEGSTEQYDEPLPPLEAISEAVRMRMRPVFMSTLTSVGGMTPLVLFPGSGSELYRGLGSVVIGGLVVATIFTLVLVPLLFSLVVQMREGVGELLGRTPDPAPTTSIQSISRATSPSEVSAQASSFNGAGSKQEAEHAEEKEPVSAG